MFFKSIMKRSIKFAFYFGRPERRPDWDTYIMYNIYIAYIHDLICNNVGVGF